MVPVRRCDAKKNQKKLKKDLWISKKVVPLHHPNDKGQRFGSLAQLVQSVCLTSRGSGVRLPQLPQEREDDKMSPSLFIISFYRLAGRSRATMYLSPKIWT